jgi:ATP phosphoribosyltransferase regulatory subunit
MSGPAGMSDRIPSGTRDVLPDEMRELRALTDRIRGVFEAAGYGEVYTPALEYERSLGGSADWPRPSYRLFDEHGNVLALRSDMTIPIARLASTRYATARVPLRFCYVAHAYRSVERGRGQSREFLQAGIELIGEPAPRGSAEALTVLCESLLAAGLRNFRVGLGDATLYPALLASHGVEAQQAERILAHLARGSFVGVRSELRELRLSADDEELLLRVPRTRGGPEVLEHAAAPLRDATAGLREVHELLAPTVAQRVIFDLGLIRNLSYYTGAVFRVYDPAHGVPIGGGGQYDDLLAQFGRPLPAVGFGLAVELLHIALMAEERAGG